MTEHTKISQPYRIKLQGSGYYPKLYDRRNQRIEQGEIERIRFD